jgi:polar amino acid transport system ATP-binding protein
MPILEVHNIHKALGGVSVLRGVSFNLERGAACAVIGPSGGGKTTLLKCLNLLTTIDCGEIVLDGAVTISARPGTGPVIATDPPTLRRRIGMVFQEWNLWPNLTIRQNVAAAPRFVLGMTRHEADDLAGHLCERVKIAEKLDSYPHSLSGGQKQRAGIARALAMSPDILMLDEVTSALDPVLAAEVLDVITNLKQDGLTLLVVTHHMEFARAIADRIMFMHNGTVHEAGTADILDNPGTAELAWFLQRLRRAH